MRCILRFSMGVFRRDRARCYELDRARGVELDIKRCKCIFVRMRKGNLVVESKDKSVNSMEKIKV